MDDARLPPLKDDLRGPKDDETPAGFSEQSESVGFTHRQRAHAKLKPTAMQPSSKASALPEGADSETPRRVNPAPHLAIAPKAEAAATHHLLRPGLERQTHDPLAKTTDLRPFADQLVAIAEQLRTGFVTPEAQTGSDQTSPIGLPAPPRSTSQLDSTPLSQGENAALTSSDASQRRNVFAEMARIAYAKRRKRASIFGDPELFGEPGWDILLDLYIAQAEHKPVSVSSACIGSASPPTTGLRWLGVLADQGLVERKHDPEDQRRVLVRLTDKALDAMDTYFASSASLQRDRRAAGA